MIEFLSGLKARFVLAWTVFKQPPVYYPYYQPISQYPQPVVEFANSWVDNHIDSLVEFDYEDLIVDLPVSWSEAWVDLFKQYILSNGLDYNVYEDELRITWLDDDNTNPKMVGGPWEKWYKMLVSKKAALPRLERNLKHFMETYSGELYIGMLVILPYDLTADVKLLQRVIQPYNAALRTKVVDGKLEYGVYLPHKEWEEASLNDIQKID